MIAAVALLLASSASRAGSNGRAPINIQSDSDFSTCGCVASGQGTASSPYVIGPLSINNVHGAAVQIDGTSLTKSFNLYNLTIAGNATTTDTGIVLNHINPSGAQTIVAEVTGSATSI